MDEQYVDQVRLLLSVLPDIGKRCADPTLVPRGEAFGESLRLDDSSYIGRSPMRNDDLDAKGKDVGGSAAANGAAAVARKRKKRRSWSAEKKIRIARESFSTQESVTAVARRYGIARNRLSAWRSLLRRGKLVAPSSDPQAGIKPGWGFCRR